MKHPRIYLRLERERQGLTQLDLEAKSGVAQNTISKLETGKVADTTSSTLLKIAAALDVDPRDLHLGPAPDDAATSAPTQSTASNRRRTEADRRRRGRGKR